MNVCILCGLTINQDSQGVWVDSTGGDGCEDYFPHFPASDYALCDTCAGPMPIGNGSVCEQCVDRERDADTTRLQETVY